MKKKIRPKKHKPMSKKNSKKKIQTLFPPNLLCRALSKPLVPLPISGQWSACAPQL